MALFPRVVAPLLVPIMALTVPRPVPAAPGPSLQLAWPADHIQLKLPTVDDHWTEKHSYGKSPWTLKQ